MSDSEREFLHELNNHLGVARGMLELVLEAQPPLAPGAEESPDLRRVRKALGSVMRAADRVLARRREMKALEPDSPA